MSKEKGFATDTKEGMVEKTQVSLYIKGEVLSQTEK